MSSRKRHELFFLFIILSCEKKEEETKKRENDSCKNLSMEQKKRGEYVLRAVSMVIGQKDAKSSFFFKSYQSKYYE